MLRWRDRATSGTPSSGWLIGLALLAAVAEVATMLPYLAAVGMLTTAHLAAPTVGALLAAYCLVMILPAAALLTARVGWADLIRPLLSRLDRWMVGKAGSATGWVLGIAGFLLARDAAAHLLNL